MTRVLIIAVVLLWTSPASAGSLTQFINIPTIQSVAAGFTPSAAGGPQNYLRRVAILVQKLVGRSPRIR